jgi:hypothetical protein
MKKILLFTFILLALNSVSFAQCTANMSGTFIQRDSCSSFSSIVTRTVTTGDVGFDNLYITNFGRFNPPNDVQVHLDCSNYTLTMYQTLGTTNLTGSGSFTPDYNNMIISYYVDFGSSSMNCVDVYTRSTSAITDLNYPLEIIAYPNPATEFLIVKFSNMLRTNTIVVLDANGRAVLKKIIEAGQEEAKLDLTGLSTGVYNVQVNNGQRIANQRVVIY